MNFGESSRTIDNLLFTISNTFGPAVNAPAKYVLGAPPAITGNPPGPKILSDKIEGLTFPYLST